MRQLLRDVAILRASFVCMPNSTKPIACVERGRVTFGFGALVL